MLVKVLKSISDDGSIELFRLIATKHSGSELLRSETKMTRKQYYSRMSRLMKTGMVKRKNGRHYLTAFGKVVYDAQATIKKAVESYWKLKAIDSIDLSDDITLNERNKLIDTLLDDLEIKEILSKHAS